MKCNKNEYQKSIIAKLHEENVNDKGSLSNLNKT